MTVTFWRGEAVELEKDGLRLRTDAAPLSEGQITAAIGTFAGLLAVLGLGTGISALRSAGRPGVDRLGRPSAAKPLVLVAMLVSAVAAAPVLPNVLRHTLLRRERSITIGRLTGC